MLIDGFNAIAMGENPRLIEIKLSSYVKNWYGTQKKEGWRTT
jgi:hypothetical protein